MTNEADQGPRQTGDSNDPWGYNNHPREEATYRGIKIPVIDGDSSHDELIRYIRILEDRLHMTHVYVARPEGMPEGLEDLGAVLPHDLPPEKRDTPRVLDLVRVSQNQAERVSMLARGIDRVGCLEIGQKIMREGIDPDDT